MILGHLGLSEIERKGLHISPGPFKRHVPRVHESVPPRIESVVRTLSCARMIIQTHDCGIVTETSRDITGEPKY